MLTPILNHESHKALYIQLYEYIKSEIIARHLQPHDELPSKRALAAHLDISVKTVENAYAQLLLEGYLYSKEKSGYFVNPLSDYRTRKKPVSNFISKYKEDTYRVDLKANKNNIEEFPASVWYRMFRETLSYEGERLFDTVPFNGIPELRVQIARYLLDFRGMEVSPDQIIIGAGTEYLYIRLIQLLGRHSKFAMEDPGYHKILNIYQVNDVAYAPIPLDKDGIRTDKLRETDCNIVHISPAHHFPLGFVTSIQRRLELLKWANEAPDRYIIEDDFDSEYRYHGRPVPPVYSIDIQGKVIYINTFSKCIAPAVRISYMVLPEKLMEKYLSTMSFYSCTVPSFDQFALVRFMSNGHLERYINRTKRSNAARKESFIELLKSSSAASRFHIIEYAAGTQFLLKLDTALSDPEIRDYMRRAEILIACLSEYCEIYNPEYASTLVINYSGITKEQMEYFIRVLEQMLVTVQTS